jgi:carbohydrate-selective porin OprB
VSRFVVKWCRVRRPLAIASLTVMLGTARADVAVDPCACSPNKPGFHRSSALTGEWNGVRADLFERGVKITGTYAGELFASPTLDTDRVVVAGLAALAIDVDLAKLVDDRLGALKLSGFGIHGRGLSERIMDVYGVSNNVAKPDVRLFEAWYEQPLGPVTLRAGLLAADQEFVLAEHSTVLLDATFGILAMVSYNIGNPVYPVATPGASAQLETDAVAVRAAIYDGDQPNEHGLPTGLGDHAFLIGEVELAGTLKLGAWHHTERGSGYYAIVDHQLERYVGTFARLSVAPDKPIELYADAGLRIGPGPLRKRDFASLALAFARTEVGAQTVVEATYQILVNGWLTVQPDAQLVLTRDGTAGVLATRAVVAL